MGRSGAKGLPVTPLAGVAAAAAIAALGLARYQPAKTVAVAERVEPLLSA